MCVKNCFLSFLTSPEGKWLSLAGCKHADNVESVVKKLVLIVILNPAVRFVTVQLSWTDPVTQEKNLIGFTCKSLCKKLIWVFIFSRFELQVSFKLVWEGSLCDFHISELFYYLLCIFALLGQNILTAVISPEKKRGWDSELFWKVRLCKFGFRLTTTLRLFRPKEHVFKNNSESFIWLAVRQ